MLPGANAASNCCTSRPANRSCVTSPRPSPGYTPMPAQPSAWSVSASVATSPTLAATEFDLPAVAVIYGGMLPTIDIPIGRPEPTLARTPQITGRLLVLVGEEDQVVPPEHRRDIAQAMRTAGVRHEIITYPGVGHGFLNDRRATYNPAAAHDAWQRVQDLLTDELSTRPAEADSPRTSAR